MDEGQLSELTDSENWPHLYTRLHSLACSRKAWQMSALLSLLLPRCQLPPDPSEWVEHQTQYGVCKESQAGTGKTEGFEENNNEPAT